MVSGTHDPLVLFYAEDGEIFHLRGEDRRHPRCTPDRPPGMLIPRSDVTRRGLTLCQACADAPTGDRAASN